MSDESRPWHHRPLHVFVPGTIYMITAATLHKQRYFCDSERLTLVETTLFEVASDYGWLLQAWAVLPNHYHFIAQSPENGKPLKPMIQRLHSQTARHLNAMDQARGRQVWFQYWDTCITFEKSYYPRLNYAHNNPVKHGLVTSAEQYPFCSAAWFLSEAEPSFRRKVESFRYDRLTVMDDF
jgi:putative transposase